MLINSSIWGDNMTNDEIISLREKRDFKVSKSNQLVQKARYELSHAEQKTANYICSMIKPRTDFEKVNKTPFILEYEFNIREYCKVCGIDYSGGQNYKDIKATIKKLADRSIWLDDGENEILMRWLSYVKINKKSEKVNIEIDRTIAPYLFDLQEKFVSYGLHSILAMKSQYSIRIYELLKSYAYQHSKTFEIDELKRLLMVENNKSYKNFFDFKKRVLEIAQKEINEYTDIKISCKPIKKGNKVVKLEFQMVYKTGVENVKSQVAISEVLGEIAVTEDTDIEGQITML